MAHIGVLKALEAAGYQVKRIIGTSSGSLVGALYASCEDAEALEKYAAKLSFRKVLGLSFSREGVSSGRGVERLVKEFTDAETFEDLRIPLVVNATDLFTGKEVVFRKGALLPALHASSAFPGVISPMETHGRLLVDGGLSATVAIHLAPKTARVVVSDVTGGETLVKHPSRFRIMSQALHFLIQKDVEHALRRSAHRFVRVRPDVQEWGIFSLPNSSVLIRRGEEAMRSSLPSLQRLLR